MSKYIGKGTYGCIINPSIKCDGIFGNTDEISKFFYFEKDYLIEKDLQDIIEKIDINNNYTIKRIDNCKIKLTNDIKKNIYNFNKCNIITNNIYQITYEYGGIDLYKIFTNNLDEMLRIDLNFFLKKFLNIFEGICNLDSNNYVHFDLRLDNILFNFKKNKFVIIDFGLMKEKNKLYDYKFIKSFTNNPYPFYPNEINILNLILNGYFKNPINDKILNSKLYSSYIEAKIIYLLKKYSKKNIYFKKYIKKFQDIYDYINNDIKNNFKTTLKLFDNFFEDFLKYNTTSHEKIEININNDLKNICNDIKSKVDVYMLGLVLLELLIYIFKYLDNNITIKKIPIEIFDLIFEMISINPCNRPTIYEATLKYKQIMKI